jgi:hypothetical protein
MAHPAIFFCSVGAPAHWAAAAGAPGSAQDRCRHCFLRASTLVLASLVRSECQASKQKSPCLSPFPYAILLYFPLCSSPATPRHAATATVSC